MSSRLQRRNLPIGLWLRGLLFVTALLGVIILFHRYIGLRLIRDVGWSASTQAILWAALWSAFGSIFVSFMSGRLLSRAAARGLQWVGFVWMGAFALLLSACAFTDVVFWAAERAGFQPENPGATQAATIVALFLPSMVWGLWSARGGPRVKRLEVPIRGLKAGLNGLKIVQISDVHIGETLGSDFMNRVVARVNSLKPDMVAVTGDLVDGTVAQLHQEVAGLQKLEAPLGVFYVTGNHEYYHGGEAWMSEMRRQGLTALHNQHHVIERDGAQLVVAGVPDVEGARFSQDHTPSIDLALQGAPAEVPRILLAHQPRFAKSIQGRDIQLMLSGHTHAGQIFPFMFFVPLQQPVIAGFKVLWGTPTYTSSGTGYWGPPLRVGTRSEITELTLRTA